MSPAPVTSRSDSRLSREKGVLFCPECWHESPVDGDWQVRATDEGDRLDCPACGEPITVRPRANAETASITLPVFACSLADARLTARLRGLARRLCITPGVSTLRDGPSCSLSTTADSARQP